MEDLPISALRIRLGSVVGLGHGSLPVRRDDSTIPSTEELGSAYLGPHALAMFVSAIEMGIIVSCFARFLARSERERTRIKVLVYFLTCMATCVMFFFFTLPWRCY
jgi:F0F1-type ATP synthase membrane subunit c/vacuolar-type H+-ATPase subunit K